MISKINSAKRYILVAVYSLTSREISEAFIKAKKRGVDVKIITDGEQAEGRFSKDEFLRKNGIEVKIADYSSRKRGFLTPKMHHKFAVIDGETVITGSYNFTASAENLNDENCIFIEDKEITKKFENEFWRIWKLSK